MYMKIESKKKKTKFKSQQLDLYLKEYLYEKMIANNPNYCPCEHCDGPLMYFVRTMESHSLN